MLGELKSRLDALSTELDLGDGEFTADELARMETASANFRAASSGLLAEATPYLWAYYRDVAAEFTPAQRAAYQIPELDPSSDIWTQVSLSLPPTAELGRPPYAPASVYLSFEGEVSWEPEHGLQLVFEDGRHLCKVGPFDGHTTNAHASADLSLLGTIYRR